jgi:hypothetical protein
MGTLTTGSVTISQGSLNRLNVRLLCPPFARRQCRSSDAINSKLMRSQSSMPLRPTVMIPSWRRCARMRHAASMVKPR